MKRYARFLGVFLFALILSVSILPVSAFAADSAVISAENSSEGYFTVNYTEGSPVKMKVGVTFNGSTKYYDYTHGENSAYTFIHGSGTYTITLFRNVKGTSYTPVATEKVAVNIVDAFAPYKASTAEITFSKDDSVGMLAEELCAEFTDTSAKVLAIHNYIASNFSYDYDFASKIINGTVKTYVPNTNDVLAAKKGICYDLSALFAALCRSQEIPCTLEKGYYNGAYHAWNKVYIDNAWYYVDLTLSSSYRINADELTDCIIHVGGNSSYQY